MRRLYDHNETTTVEIEPAMDVVLEVFTTPTGEKVHFSKKCASLKLSKHLRSQSTCSICSPYVKKKVV